MRLEGQQTAADENMDDALIRWDNTLGTCLSVQPKEINNLWIQSLIKSSVRSVT